MRALIVGGSLGGLFAANLLHRAGWDVSVFERATEGLSGRGAGIVTHPELVSALARAGVDPNAALGVEVSGRIVLDARGATLCEVPHRQILTSWGRLHRLLMDALPSSSSSSSVQHGVTIQRIEERELSIVMHGACSRGAIEEEADLVVAADGIRSTLREQLLPGVRAEYAGYVAWRGLVDEHLLSRETRSLLFERFGFCLPEGEQMLGYPVAGAGDSLKPGERRYNFVWYRPADAHRALPDLLTDVSGRMHAANISPHSIRPEVIAAMRRDAETVLAPQFAEIVRGTTQPFLQPIHDLMSPRLAFGRVALVGDAAFVARPHVGMGVTKAAEDAVALADALTAGLTAARNDGVVDVPSALLDYDNARRPTGAAIVERARNLGAYMQAQAKSADERAMAARYRTPHAVMCQTALSAGAADALEAAELQYRQDAHGRARCAT